MAANYHLIELFPWLFPYWTRLPAYPRCAPSFIRKPADEKIWPFWQRQFHKWEEWLQKLDAGYARLPELAMGQRNKILIGGFLLTLGTLTDLFDAQNATVSARTNYVNSPNELNLAPFEHGYFSQPVAPTL